MRPITATAATLPHNRPGPQTRCPIAVSLMENGYSRSAPKSNGESNGESPGKQGEAEGSRDPYSYSRSFSGMPATRVIRSSMKYCSARFRRAAGLVTR